MWYISFDDILHFCSFKESKISQTKVLYKLHANIKQWLPVSENYLLLNSDKTESLINAPEMKFSQVKQLSGVLDSVQPESWVSFLILQHF